ncbi:MAG: cysteinyl-tRNA synthetase [Candidatus Dependentiae bacterium]|nr:cysteinyl-tRNA synthetase [Candidatus Dependentiae bacterium]
MMSKLLYLLNTQSGVKEPFMVDGMVKMYVCGVTPYAYAHMGHARCYVSFDLLYRMLQFWGYSVTYIQNVTDVDDKIVRKAIEEVGECGNIVAAATAIADQYTKAFNQDMAALNVLPPTQQPTISENVPAIISFIEKLIAQGYAYVAGEDVYFSIDAHKAYGHLSGRTLEELAAGARVEVSECKKNSGDFALWKGNVVGSLWQSPWGKGRPGWHIECSALARNYLGEHLDIHGGGIDLLFPHHENECAQSEALFGAPFARYWLHNAHVTLQSEKMSKSLGNVFTIRDVLATHDPMIVRFYLLQHQYRTPLDIDMTHITSAAKAYNRLARALNPQNEKLSTFDSAVARRAWESALPFSPVLAQITEALADDLNVPKALGLIFSNLELLAGQPIVTYALRVLFQQVFGLECITKVQEMADESISPEITRLIEARAAARAAKDWIRADQLRNELAQLGYTAVDGKVTR